MAKTEYTNPEEFVGGTADIGPPSDSAQDLKDQAVGVPPEDSMLRDDPLLAPADKALPNTQKDDMWALFPEMTGAELGDFVKRAGDDGNVRPTNRAPIALPPEEKIEVGNVLMYGLGNEVLTSAMPTSIKLGAGNIRSAASGAEAAVGDGLVDALSVSSDRAMKNRAHEAVDMPKGEERTAALRDTADHHNTNILQSVQDSLEVADTAASSFTGKTVEFALKSALPDNNVSQMNWATSMSDAAARARASLIEQGGDPQIEKALLALSRGFDKTEDRASWFSHARAMAGVMDSLADRPIPQESRDAVYSIRNSLRSGITNTSLFGDAADIVDDMQRALPSKLQTSYTNEQVQQMLHTDAGRTALEGVLSSMENVANVHQRRSTASPTVVNKITKAADNLRDALGLFDDVRSAGALQDHSDASEGMGQIAATQTAARWLSKSTARSMAGVAKSAPVSAPQSTLDRFSQGFASPEASFQAKKQALTAIANDPSLLTETMAVSLGAMPSDSPQLFMKVAGRIAKCVQYVSQTMPASAAEGPLFPNGSPPPRSLIREWATKWNTAFHPETVYEDLKSNTVIPSQMRTLEDLHPDLYSQFKQDVVVEVGTHFRSVPYATKASLDLLFGMDGMAGPMFSTYAADQINQGNQERKGQPMPASAKLPGGSSNAVGPSGLSSIQSSVTNKSAV